MATDIIDEYNDEQVSTYNYANDKDRGILATIKRRKLNFRSVEKENLDSARVAMRMYMGELGQWDEQAYNNRVIDGRPALSMNVCKQFVRRITNPTRNNLPSPKVIALDEAFKKNQEIAEGRIRHIMNLPTSRYALLAANEQQAASGLGYVILRTKYTNDKSFNQEIYIDQIIDSSLVCVDPNAYLMDRSDAQWCSIDTLMHKSDVIEKYGKKAYNPNDSINLENDNKETVKDSMWLTEYYCLESKKSHTLYSYVDEFGMEGISNMLPVNAQKISERPIFKKVVKCYICSEHAVLEEKEYEMDELPLVAFIDQEVVIAGVRYRKGMLQDLCDPQRGLNFAQTSIVELVDNMPRTPIYVTVEQVRNHEDDFANNTFKPYQLYNADPLAPPPRRENAEAPIQALVQLSQNFIELMKNISGVHDQMVGDEGNEISAVAINARRLQGEISTYSTQDNFNTSVISIGRKIIKLFPSTHDTIQTIATQTPAGESKYVEINNKDSEDYIDFTYNDYEITVDIGASFKNKEQETGAQLLEMIKLDPTLINRLGDLAIKYTVGNQDIEARMKLGLTPEVQDFLMSKEKEENKDLDPVVIAKIVALEKENKALLVMNNDLLNKDELDLYKARLDNATKQIIAANKNTTDLIKEDIKYNEIAGHKVLQHELNLNEARTANAESYFMAQDAEAKNLEASMRPQLPITVNAAQAQPQQMQPQVPQQVPNAIP